MKKLLSLSILLGLLTGCFSDKIEIQPTKTWEGHFMNTNDFYNATSNINLEKNESIWVLSNQTLNRLLQNVQGK